MEKHQMKLLGIVCLIVCAVCVFIAFERYQTNANNVQAMNQFRNSSPLGGNDERDDWAIANETCDSCRH